MPQMQLAFASIPARMTPVGRARNSDEIKISRIAGLDTHNSILDTQL